MWDAGAQQRGRESRETGARGARRLSFGAAAGRPTGPVGGPRRPVWAARRGWGRTPRGCRTPSGQSQRCGTALKSPQVTSGGWRRQELRRRSEDRCPRGRGPGPPVWRERPRRALGAPADGAVRGPKIRGTQIPAARLFVGGFGCLDVVWARVGCGRRPVPTALCWRVGNPANGTAWMGRFEGRRCPERRTLAWILGQVLAERLECAACDLPQDTFR